MKNTVKKVLGDPQEQLLKKLKKQVEKINSLEEDLKKLSDGELKESSAKLKKRVQEDGESLNRVLPEAFALVREAARRTLGQRHFDVQLMGGMILHEGKVAEMKTGEGKTLVATLPVYLNALSGKGAHVVTVNDYLTKRDAGWMAQVYSFLEMSVGVIVPEESFIYDPEYESLEEHHDDRLKHLRPCSRKEAYDADITYGTNNEYGFDYLRDNMVSDVENLRQRDLNFAIVDEVDSILIDEARTPLIISASASESGAGYKMFAEIATHFEPGDYVLEEKRKRVNLTDDGINKVEQLLDLEDLYNPRNVHHIFHLEQALNAQTLFKKDKDYVVTKDGEIVIVDANTGRLLPGRRYSEGLHQAIEAKEGVEIKEESVTLATTSFQNYFRLYAKLSGMTGTAKTEEEEFVQVYGMDVIQVPSNKKLARKDRNDRIYATESAKFKAIIEKVKELREVGQPVLIGTVSIEKNEILAGLLEDAKIPHRVLNAKNNEEEALIIERAGDKGAVTLATNIAGRGTDIVLSDEVKELGGLFVLGSERHESRRIDNQLRGRAGRQGDPGETQFFISAEDELMRVFGGETIVKLMARLGSDDDDPIEKRSISRAIERSQKLVEGMHFDSRKNVVEYDDVMNRHRKAVYSTRRAMLKAEDDQKIKDLVNSTVKSWAKKTAQELNNLTEKREDLKKRLDRAREDFNLRPDDYAKISESLGFVESDEEETEAKKKGLLTKLNPLNMIKSSSAKLKRFVKKKKERSGSQKQKKARRKLIEATLISAFKETEDKALAQADAEAVFRVQRGLYLEFLDELWMQHLENMGHLREGIGWVGIGQKDPLVEYRFEGQRIFDEMMDNLKSEFTRALSNLNPKSFNTMQIETELTKAAGRSIENTNEITSAMKEFDANDFAGATRVIEIDDEGGEKVLSSKGVQVAQKPSKNKATKKVARKKQRQNKKKGRR